MGMFDTSLMPDREWLNRMDKELPPERMHNRCPLCMIYIPRQANKGYIESKVLHVVGVHHRTIEEANDLISRYNPGES